MRGILTIFLSFTLLMSSNAFAAKSVANLVRDYQVAISVHNIPTEQAAKIFTESILKNRISQSDILLYLQNNLTAEDFKEIKSIITYNNEEMLQTDLVNQDEFTFLLQEAVLATSKNYGADYTGCIAGFVTLGAATITGSILLAVSGGDSVTTDIIASEEMNIAAAVAGVLIAIGLTLAVGSVAICKRI